MQATDPAEWLADLILAHLSQLTAQATAHARAQVPWYQAQPEARIHNLLAGDYRALAVALRANDIPGLRVHVERVTQDCIRSGAPAIELIQVAELVEAEVRILIEADLTENSALAADAMRRMQTLTKNIRMIISAINLRLLTNLPL